jgi:type II secretory pathway component PulJ
MKNASRKGYSMLEVLVAAFIFALAIIPIYRILAQQSAQEVETAKIALAKSIAASVKEEILSRPFEEVFATVSNGKLEGQPYPFSLTKLLDAQRNYRDFELEVFATPKMDDKALEMKAVVTFTGLNGVIKTEELPFLHVLQDY